jgi:HSP20 family molecular chaperone IbpA
MNAECTIANDTDRTVTNRVSETQETTREEGRFVAPVVDIFETADGLSVVADLPGMALDQINVSVEKDVLTIKAPAPVSPERSYSYREFEPVGYFRQFRLGNKIDQGAIKAEYQHGVLKLSLPFAAESKPRLIEVRVAS